MVNIRILYTIFLFLSTTFILAQTKFESGFILDKNDKKINCLIKNNRWLASPTQITYKLNENSDEIVADPMFINGFQLKGGGFYKTLTADFPYYEDKVAQQNTNAEITTVSRTVFVKRILKGKVSLFEYRLGNESVYLYGFENKPLVVLLYNEYLGEDNRIRSNTVFRNQLYKDVKCGRNVVIQDLKYSRKALETYFNDYNKCMDPERQFKEENKTEKLKSKRALILWAGIQRYDLSITSPQRTFNYSNTITPKVGIEFENIFRFNNNKWGMFVSASYTSHKSEATVIFNSSVQLTDPEEFELSRLETLLGARHYVFLNDKSSIFLEAGSAFDFDFKTNITGAGISESRLNENKVNFAVLAGLGYSYNQKLYSRVNYYFDQNILTFLASVKNSLSRLSITIGYKL